MHKISALTIETGIEVHQLQGAWKVPLLDVRETSYHLCNRNRVDTSVDSNGA